MILGPDGAPWSAAKAEAEEKRKKAEDRRRLADEMILAAARQELKWGEGDERHDHQRWKMELRKRLWEELRMDLDVYT